MAPRVLSDAEHEALTSWPSAVAHSDLVEYFTLDVDDMRWAPSHRGSATRIGLADGRLRRLHVASVIERAGWRSCGPEERKRLADWLVARALEHDDASLLFGQVLEHLRAQRIVRPGLDRLLRSVGEAREAADKEIHWRLRPQLSASRCGQLDALVVTDAELGIAPLVWLDRGATSSSPDAIKAEIAKLSYLRELGADRRRLPTPFDECRAPGPGAGPDRLLRPFRRSELPSLMAEAGAPRRLRRRGRTGDIQRIAERGGVRTHLV